MTKQQIKCPQCDASIDVSEVLLHQLQEQVKMEYSGKFLNLEKQQKKLDDAIAEGVKKKLQAEKSAIEKKLRAEITGENAEAIKSLEEQLEEKSKEVKEHNKLKTQLSKALREKDELKEKIEAEAEEKITQRVTEERNKLRNLVEKEHELKISEKDNMIDTLTGQLKDMQRKLEQGSMQVQGETQELAIEEYLRANFPLDSVNEVKKGARGADSLQIVNTRTKLNCGSVYYESKRTKEFSEGWIEKFKGDMRLKNATLGAIVTDTMPKDMPHFGLRDGIYICTYLEFKALAFVLRETVIMYSGAIATQENKGEKMAMLYDYLCGTEFQREVTAIVEAFTQLSNDLQSEQRSMAMIWKKRQKQIDKVLQSTIHMYGSVRGIAGSAIQSIPQLELSSGNEQA